jgi:hypothetical protein
VWVGNLTEGGNLGWRPVRKKSRLIGSLVVWATVLAFCIGMAAIAILMRTTETRPRRKTVMNENPEVSNKKRVTQNETAMSGIGTKSPASRKVEKALVLGPEPNKLWGVKE